MSNILEDSQATPMINISPSSSESISCVSSIPEAGVILWNEKELRRKDLPTLVFWTVFEQLNVQASEQFNQIKDRYASGGLNLDQAVERIERLEHENALHAKSLMISAVAQKLITPPTDGFDTISNDFATHYRFQQLKGHSQRIADRLAPYCPGEDGSTFKGTWKMDVRNLSQYEKQQVDDLFRLKLQLEDPASYDRALLKLGCNLKLAERKEPLGKEPFLKQASQEIFSNNELNAALSKATDFLNKTRPNIKPAGK
ncbi:MAG: hypothetical protein JSR39_07755 [Verrucomicrobia bacterium]|nr:hypothetical protein [Verrucomicrobiota bacterium]